MIHQITHSLKEAQTTLNNLLNNQEILKNINEAALMLIKTFEEKGTVFSCGNGGSMCDAMHFAEELTGQYRKRRRGLPAIAISDPSHLTCVGNDYGFDEVFSRYLEAHGKSQDCLVALSTSGTSKNILKAVSFAKSIGMKVIALSGRPGSILTEQANVSICTPGGDFADRVQEIHIKVLHILIELVERHFFKENYA